MTTAEASFSGSRLLARGAIGPGQATPKAWVTQTVPNAKTAPINGLTALRSATIRANGSNIAAFASYLGENLLLVRSAKGTSYGLAVLHQSGDQRRFTVAMPLRLSMSRSGCLH